MAATLRHLEPNFYRDGDEVMFCFPVSEGHIIGPRPALPLDKETHPGAWSAFEASEAPKIAEAAHKPPAKKPATKKAAPKLKRGAKA